jgi:hypothetical protein
MYAPAYPDAYNGFARRKRDVKDDYTRVARAQAAESLEGESLRYLLPTASAARLTLLYTW